MPIVLQDQSGLAQGISTAGSALAGALQQRGQQKFQQQSRNTLSDVISKADFSTQEGQRNFMQQATAANIPMNEVTSILDTAIKMSKVEASKNALPDIINRNKTPLQNNSQNLRATEDATKQTTPLDPSSNLQDDSRKPGMNEVKQEPLFGESIDKPKSVQISEDASVDEYQIKEMMASPDERTRKFGENLNKELLNKSKQEFNESAEIRKEDRARVRKFSEPYDDMGKLASNVSRLEQVQNIIEKDDASFDDAFWRTTATALLEDRAAYEVAELFKTPAQQKMYSLLRPFFGAKELGGSNPSTREVLLSLSALPSNLKGKEANQYIGNMLLNEAKIARESGKIINELNKKNIPWSEFQSKLQERVEPLRKEKDKELSNLVEMQFANKMIKDRSPKKEHTFMLSPKGSIEEVKNSEIKKAENSGGRLIK